MSREIPSRPSLEHLKKQAKDLLADIEQREAGVQLADAQRRLAREYGFATWAALKAHVLSRAGAAPLDTESESVPARGFSGTWRANLSRSTFPPEAEHRSVLLRLAVNGDEVTITDVIEDETGPRHHTLTIVADGRERRWEFGYAMTARWSGSRSLEAKVTKNGEPEGRVQYTLTADGEELMLEHRRADDTTGGVRIAVFDRVHEPSPSVS